MADALGSALPVPGRLATVSIDDILVIDDTYNSNPRSLRAALAAAREVADGLGARMVLAIGDMLEFGELSSQVHQEAVRDVLAERPAVLVAVGPDMRAALDRHLAIESSGTEIHFAEDSVAAGKVVARLVRPHDVLLVKASHGIAMERIIETLHHDRDQ
jgi:UDP-N-acetylmuramoyl-tripeptide--D-alanyl-D-alanine ligase